MQRFYAGLRRLYGLDDRAAAYRREQQTVSRATEVPRVDAGFAEEMSDLARRPGDSVELGASVGSPGVRVRVPLREVAGAGHALVLGTTGAGKTRAVAGIARGLLRRIATELPTELAGSSTRQRGTPRTSWYGRSVSWS
ncbi:MAG: hypothetical protein Q8S73_27010 [Deltaproteobacteria bacterium]|nr:hypothetical protein [Myxococcales bacterium]MDP3217788.1 hypothetical protein [Deltaproteobacteria bacterium]